MSARLIEFRAVVTVLLGVAYIGGLAWALVHGQIDVQSYVSGIGPAFGLAMGYWFRDRAEAERRSEGPR